MENDLPLNSFRFNSNINNKVCLYYDKKLFKQILDCVICLYNGSISFSSATQSTKLILKLAGQDLIHDLIKKTSNKDSCNDILVTQAYNYSAKHFFHIIAPTYKPKYANASYTRLHYLYWHILSLAVEMRIESVGIPCLHRQDEGFIGVEGVRIALRTVRRFLENLDDLKSLKRIVLFVPRESDQVVYRTLMSMYFPCNELEEKLSAEMSSNEVGGLNGEPLSVDGRDIRIQPGIKAFNSLQNINSSDDFERVDKSFLKMEINFDRDRILSLRRVKKPMTNKLKPINTNGLHFSANKVDEFANPRLLYRGGKDSNGCHVVVFVATHFPTKLSHSFPGWFTRRLIDLMDEKYCIVYLNTDANWIPTANCLKNFWSAVDQRFASHLSQVYVLHADNGIRFKCWLSLPSSLYSKLKFVRGVEDLYAYIPNHQITLPNHVLERDMVVNGVRYYVGPVADVVAN